MAKRKDLLLTESVTSRMMGLAGIGSLANPFLKEERSPTENQDHGSYGDQEEEMEEGYGYEDEGMHHGLHDEEDEEDPHGGMWPGEVEKMYDDEYNSRFEDEEEEEYDDEEDEEEYDDEEDEEEYDDEEDELEEGKGCKVCGKSPCACKMEESIQESMKRLKRLLEQAEADAPPPPEKEAPKEQPPVVEGGDEMEMKIKDFVKKLGELVQETLGVEVTVEEGEGEPELPEGGEGELPPPPAGGEETPPAPMAEAINRLVNKVAARVKARLMEAKGEKDKKIETKRKMDAKAKKGLQMKALKEKQAASKKKEMEAAKKKKEMEMKKKKAAMAKKK